MSKKYWEKLPQGSVVLEAGSSAKFKTGTWRSMRPKWIEENCIQCLFCWMFCPDMSVNVKDGKMTGFNFDYCKGCGICALECPGKKGNKAIVMEEEGK
ncbi:MAG: 4Fe-4S binding protein [Nitrospiraceae bacterium]|nr:MAG: 4Fe-4S binding protein [Nitrospiraceae bacterium]